MLVCCICTPHRDGRQVVPSQAIPRIRDWERLIDRGAFLSLLRPVQKTPARTDAYKKSRPVHSAGHPDEAPRRVTGIVPLHLSALRRILIFRQLSLWRPVLLLPALLRWRGVLLLTVLLLPLHPLPGWRGHRLLLPGDLAGSAIYQYFPTTG